MDDQGSIATEANAAAEIPAPAPDVVALAATEAIAAAEDPALTPAGRVRAVIERYAALPFPASRKDAAAAVIREFHPVFVALLRQCDFAELVNAIQKFADRMHALRQPAPEVPEIERADPRLRAAGWGSFEIGCLRRMLKPGEKIISATDRAVQLDTRSLSRREIRDGTRPAWWSVTGSWEAQFGGPIPGERER